ncbi:MAG: AI-2E family transporter [Proteobacteria bacterium]|nr:AI-2E family transporter [Pseudomonadota bacterium]
MTGARQNNKTQSLETRYLNANYFLLFLLILVFFACYHVVRPYIHTIIVAGLLSTIFHPLHLKLESLLKGKKNAAAFFSCFLLTILVVLPLVFMFFSVIQQGVNSFNGIRLWFETGQYATLSDHPLVIYGTGWFNRILPDLKLIFPDIDLKNIRFDKMALNLSASIGKTLLAQGGNIAGNITALIGKFFLMIFTFFFFIRDYEKIVERLLHLIPLSASQEDKIVDKIKAVGKSALLGTLVTALLQGAAGGIAFFISGLPGLFWGMVMAFASLIPMVGTALIWVPASLYLFISGHWGYGGFMVVWCVVVVGMIDNLVRPLFMQGSAGMGTLLIFFSILGGISAFGLLGLLYGPLVFGLATVLVYIYEIEYAGFLNRQDSK